MMNANERAIRWIAAVAASLALAACGGGGGGGGGDDTPSPTPDARNGSYTVVAANAQVYTLDLDFDANEFSVTGTGVNKTGTIALDGSGAFMFQPGNSTGTTGTSTLRFSYVDETVVGGFAFDGDVAPFVAARNFATTVADAAGTYDMLGRVVDSAGPENTTIQQGEVTAGGQLRLCEDASIYAIAACPAASVSQGTVTFADGLFSAATPRGRIQFRVAKVGDDNVFLRASASVGTTRRFMIGTPAGSTYARATFKGSATDGSWGTATVSSSAYSSDVVRPDGAEVAGAGSATIIGLRGGDGSSSIVAIDTTTPDIGALFSIRSSRIGVVAAARNNASVPGLLSIGVRQ